MSLIRPLSESLIDVHTHVITPSYREYLEKYGYSQPDGMPAIPPWSVDAHLEQQRQCGVAKSILSVSSPGVHLVHGQDDLAEEIARKTNDELSQICQENPDNFGFFASLPLPNIEKSLAEIDRVFKLGASGICFMSNYHSVYPGDSVLYPIFEEIDRRKAIIFIHPTSCNMISPENSSKMHVVDPIPALPRPGWEFMFDETRAIFNLLLTGTVDKFPNITYIASHCGCVFPPILRRAEYMATNFGEVKPGPDGWKPLLRTRFYFDTAGFHFPDQIYGLLRHVPADRLMYGSDFPFTPLAGTVMLKEEMDSKDGIDKLAKDHDLDPEAVKASIYYETATKVLSTQS